MGVSDWHSFYYTIGEKEKTHLYVPDDWFYDHVDRKLNDWKVAPIIDDKNLYDLLFHDTLQPKVIARKVGGSFEDAHYNFISIDEVVMLCEEYEKVIIKISLGSSGGHGIQFWQKSSNLPLKEILVSAGPIVIQEVINQHEQLSRLHPDSINTIRIMTLTEEDRVLPLSSIVRMGVGQSKVDNVSSGGIACGINPDGSLKHFAYDGLGRRYDRHPQGARFEESCIPNYHKCIEICKRLAPRIVRFSRLVSWDFAIDMEGNPVLIEANLYGGELDFHQMCNGPIFGDEINTIKMINRFL